jgi:hypothetical protein
MTRYSFCGGGERNETRGFEMLDQVSPSIRLFGEGGIDGCAATGSKID